MVVDEARARAEGGRREMRVTYNGSTSYTVGGGGIGPFI